MEANEMGKSMAGRAALVTGGSSGIGLAAALAFAREGARVAIASRDPQRGEDALRAVRQAAGAQDAAIWIRADVSVEAEVEGMVRRALDAFGRLDYAFNNGGSGGGGGWTHEISEADFDCTVSGFLKSAWLCMKHEIAAMLPQGGAIVNNSSVDGLRAFPWDPIYSAAKHGVIGLTRSAAVQYANRGIRINAVCPGWIRTPPVEGMLAQDPSWEGRMLNHQPIGRLGEAGEVAQAVVWLCSERASLMTGVALPVDGGYTAV